MIWFINKLHLDKYFENVKLFILLQLYRIQMRSQRLAHWHFWSYVVGVTVEPGKNTEGLWFMLAATQRMINRAYNFNSSNRFASVCSCVCYSILCVQTHSFLTLWVKNPEIPLIVSKDISFSRNRQ